MLPSDKFRFCIDGYTYETTLFVACALSNKVFRIIQKDPSIRQITLSFFKK